MSGHFVKIFEVQQALLYKGLQLCGLVYRVKMAIAAWNFHTTLRPLQEVDFDFGRWVGEGVGPPPLKKLFFQFSFFCATYDPKIAFWRSPRSALALLALRARLSRRSWPSKEKLWEWLSTSMLAMIKFVACFPPGKTIFSTIFCRNFSAFRLRVKAWMKALKTLYRASWTRTENVFRSLMVQESATHEEAAGQNQYTET